MEWVVSRLCFNYSPPVGHDLPSLCERCICCWYWAVLRPGRFSAYQPGVGLVSDTSQSQFVRAHVEQFAVQAFAVYPDSCMNLKRCPVSLCVCLHFFHDFLHRIFQGISKASMPWDVRCHYTTATASNCGVDVVEIREPVSFPDFDVQLWFSAACFNDCSCSESFWCGHDDVPPFLMAGNDFLPSVVMI